MDQADEDKEFAPTERRLQEARRKGEVPIGRDLLGAAGFAGLALAALGAPGATIAFGDALMVLLDQAESLAPLVVTGQSALIGGLGAAILASLLPFVLLPMVAVIAVLLAQRALVFAPARLEPKMSRISLIQGARNKFGRNGLFEFGKGFVKLLTISAILAAYLAQRVELLITGMALEPSLIAVMLGRLLLEFLLLVLVVQVVIGALDLLWQRFEHDRRHRMTRKEMTDEMKQSEGDPHFKAQRRQRALEIANNRMLADVPKADVVIVNPTHYAVALKWDRGSRGAPVCVAKGVDDIAASIRSAAMQAGVPLRRDPATARALYSTVEIGQAIRPEHYRPVAAAIRFAEAMRRRARQRPSGRLPR